MDEEIPIEVLDCDVLVLGAGVSGCSLTSELVRNGLDVVLIESGDASAYTHPLHQQASRWWMAATESPFARYQRNVIVGLAWLTQEHERDSPSYTWHGRRKKIFSFLVLEHVLSQEIRN
jgi:glycine/D-amino acid oxidase-like deaminating enzyme